MLTLAQLRAAITEEAALESLLARLSELGFSATSWQPGSFQLSLVRAVANAWSRVGQSVAALSNWAFLDSAEGDALTALAHSHYDCARFPARPTRGFASLTCSATAGPYTIIVGQLVISDAHDRRFRNTTGGTLSTAGVLQLEWEAEEPGDAGNVGSNTLQKLVTSLPGVTVNNPGLPTTWVTEAGVNEETDPKLKERCRTRWPTLTYASPADAYRHFARAASPGIARVLVDADNPRGPGTVDVYIAGDGGPSGVDDVNAAQAYIDQRRPVGASALVVAATLQSVTVTATVYHDATNASVISQVEAALRAAIRAAPIGGYDLSPGPAHVLPFSHLVSAARGVPGVVDVVFVSPTGSLVVGAYSVTFGGVVTLTPQVVTP